MDGQRACLSCTWWIFWVHNMQLLGYKIMYADAPIDGSALSDKVREAVARLWGGKAAECWCLELLKVGIAAMLFKLHNGLHCCLAFRYQSLWLEESWSSLTRMGMGAIQSITSVLFCSVPGKVLPVLLKQICNQLLKLQTWIVKVQDSFLVNQQLAFVIMEFQQGMPVLISRYMMYCLVRHSGTARIIGPLTGLYSRTESAIKWAYPASFFL